MWVFLAGATSATPVFSTSHQEGVSPGAKEPQATPERPIVVAPALKVQRAVPDHDLGVKELEVIRAGEGALVRITVENAGNQPVDVSSTGFDVHLGGIFVDTFWIDRREVPLGPGESRKTGFIPSKSGRTEVRVSMAVHPPGRDSNRDNNSLTRTLELPEVLPDFKVRNISLTPDHLVRVTLYNSLGHPSAGTRGKLEIYVDNELRETLTVDRWPRPGATARVDSTVGIKGRRTVRAAVNTNRAVREARYDNNTLEKQLVAGAFVPDLVVKELRCHGYIYDPGGAQLKVERVSLRARVENVGRADAGRGFTVDLFIDGRYSGTHPAASGVKTGSYTELSLDVLQDGRKEYRLTVDPADDVDEEREDNNSRTETVTVNRSGPHKRCS